MKLKHIIIYNSLKFLRRVLFPQQSARPSMPHKAANKSAPTSTSEASGCGRCKGQHLNNFAFDHARENKAYDLYEVAQALECFRRLRFGSLLKCIYCGSLWYHNPAQGRAQRVYERRLPLIDAWNASPLALSEAHRQILTRIGATPNGSVTLEGDATQVPCRVVTKSGEVLETAVIMMQQHAPCGSAQYRLASEIAQIEASPFALSLDVRAASSDAREVKMSFAPTLIKCAEEQYSLNWTTNFIVPEHHLAKDFKVMPMFADINALPRLAPQPNDIVIFIADVTP